MTRDNKSIAEEYVNFIQNSSKPRAIDMKLLETETENDNTLQKVMKLVKSGKLKHSDDETVKPYQNIHSELTISETSLLIRNRRLVLPNTLQEKAIMIAHEGHLGMTKTKSLLRSKLWFPAMDSMTEKIIGACHECAISMSNT